MSAKAAKKSKKGTTMTLQDFQSTWADEMDNEEDHFPTTRTATETTRPSSTRPSEGSWQRESTGFHSESRSERPSYSRDSGRREYEPRTERREERPTVEIPTSPPYTAFIRNLSWEVRQEDLAELFQELSVTGIRMPEREGKPSGIAYVEFRDVESLKKALDLDGQEFAGRGMFVSVAEPRKDDRRRDNFSRESRGEFSRESRGEFSRESRGEFHRESRDNFSRESRGEFSRESRGEFSRESRGDFHREPREFTRESRGELAREEGRDRRGFSDREGRVSAPEQGSWERGAQLPQQERKPFRTERSEEQSGDSERPRRSYNKPDTERNFGEWRREGAEKATPTNNTTTTTTETERPKPKPKTGANPFGSAAPKNIDTDAFLQHRKDEKQKEEKKQEEKAEETKKASEPSRARRESTDKKEIAPSRSDAVDTWRRGEALEPKKEGKKVAGKEGSQPNKTQDKPKKDEQPKQTQDKPKKATTTTPTTTKKKDTTNANANVFSVLGDQ